MSPDALVNLALAALFGIGLLIHGVWGVPVKSEPRCARCKYDLRGTYPNGGKQCPECGADLTHPQAVLSIRYTKQLRQAVTGGVIAGLAILVMLTMALSAIVGFEWPDLEPNSWVIARLATPREASSACYALEQRYNQGKLSKEEIAATVEHLITRICAEGDEVHRGMWCWGDRYVGQLISDGAIADRQLARLCRAYYNAAPRVVVRRRVRQGQLLPFQVSIRGVRDLPGSQQIIALRQVELDGQQDLNPLYADNNPEAARDPHCLSGHGLEAIRGRIRVDAPVGRHELQFDFDVGAVPAYKRFRAGVVQYLPGQVDMWPTPNYRWSTTVTATVTVVGPDEDVIELIDDPGLGPAKNKEISVLGVTTRLYRGKVLGRIRLERSEKATTPVSFDVLLRVEDKEYPAGHLIRIGGTSNWSDPSILVGSLAPGIGSADVVLRPSRDRAMHWPPEAERIWGKTIEFLDVPIERGDLERSGE